LILEPNHDSKIRREGLGPINISSSKYHKLGRPIEPKKLRSKTNKNKMDRPAVQQWKQEYVGGQNAILQAGYNTSTPNGRFQENPYKYG